MLVIPDDPRSYFYAGNLEADAGNAEQAIKHYEKTIQIIEADASYLQMELSLGNFNDVYLKVGELYHQQGDIKTAVIYFERALVLDPTFSRQIHCRGTKRFR